MKLLLVASWIACAGLPAQQRPASTLPRGFLTKSIRVGDSDRPYVLYVPRAYTPDERWPLILFLHGASECGEDGLEQLAVGLAPAILRDVDAWPFLVLLPQKPDADSAWEAHDEMLVSMLERTQQEYAVDVRQRFLTGLSQGGHGTWVLGGRHREMWTGIAPVCGYGDPATIAPSLAAMPIWCFHGGADEAVPVRQAMDLVAAVKGAGGHPRLTVFDGVGHDSWTQAYGEAGLGAWFLGLGATRVLEGFTARPGSLRGAHVELQLAWRSDGGPAHVGTKTLRIALDDEHLRWELVTEYAPGTIVAAPEPLRGKLVRRPGIDRLLAHLRELRDCGVFDLPIRIHPREPRGAVMATERWAIHVRLSDKNGLWRFSRDLPELANAAARFAPAVRGLRALLDGFAEGR